MRAYTVGVAALALDVDAKWVDNVLSHHYIPGVARQRQGIQRRISGDALLVLAIARTLITGLSVPIARAIELAGQLAGSSSAKASDTVTVAVDVTLISRELNERLADAVESAAHRKRGRPPN